jgi:hypothetical protein
MSCGLASLSATLHTVFAVDDQPIFDSIDVANVRLSYFPTVTLLLFLPASVIPPVVFGLCELVRRLHLVEHLLFLFDSYDVLHHFSRTVPRLFVLRVQSVLRE